MTTTSHTPDETPDTSLTPFPRRNHLNRLRRQRTKRRARIMGASALALGLTLGGTGVAASWATPTVDPSVKPLMPSATSMADASTQLQAADEAQSTASSALDDANAALDRADDSVDTATLASYVKDLEAADPREPDATLSVAKKTMSETATVTADIEADEKAEAAAKAAAEAAAKKKAEEAARAQAAANTPAGAKATAARMAAQKYGWGSGQFSCLSSLWAKESGWSYTASNASSGAYGIPQALPGSKMASVGSDWATNATTQIAWGLDYIKRAYGTPCAAWGHSQAMNWY
ncbi:hypothetical protein SAMN04489806_1535 [Paramicrobacterium humi]|uniref:Transglycosylase SLT domain-containing protein n=1 Tax=Paramicrobacterium humi TaxID=640635 RepID=A0A1H4LGD2_9MICO|nr:phospholipase [Microbacterium humi]SEB69760.1 hypothetical protein SAMN04489806_1535 [Microbacterium humi]